MYRPPLPSGKIEGRGWESGAQIRRNQNKSSLTLENSIFTRNELQTAESGTEHSFIAQMVEHRTGFARSRAETPLKS